MKNHFLICFFAINLFFGCASTPNVSKLKPTQNKKVNVIELPSLPLSGSTTELFQTGGYSGLTLISQEGSKLQIRTHSDRGPNGQEIFYLAGVGKRLRVFPQPEFQVFWIDYSYDLATHEISVLQKTDLQDQHGKPIQGLPPTDTHNKIEIALDRKGNPLPQRLKKSQIKNFDFEGICKTDDQSFWMSDEYYPAIAHFNMYGKLLEGFYPGKGLDKILVNRKLNRGLEGLTCFQNRLFAILQSPIEIGGAKNKKTIRFLEFDLQKKQQVGSYLLLLDSEQVDKIGDISTIDGVHFYSIEQNSKTGTEGVHQLIMFELEAYKNLMQPAYSEIEPEKLSVEELQKKDMALRKTKIARLEDLGISQFDKIEGLMIINPKRFLLITDNDFAMSGDVDFNQTNLNLDKNKKSVLIDLSLEAGDDTLK
jgi:hypothetical protein